MIFDPMRRVAIICGLLLCTAFAVASWVHDIVRDAGNPKRLEGVVMDNTGAPIPWVEVEVYDHPELWDEASLSVVAIRVKQKKIASVTADENGHFRIRHLHKGSYEVQFTRMGWSILSVLLKVDPHGEKLCAELQISGGGAGESRVHPCH
ncbi:MAG: carboxypeptidase-like regulatory domain-containing protein [Terriglobales bacterium]